jgi:hypothetical protein
MPTFQKLGPQSGEVAFLKTLRGLGHVGRRAAHRSRRTHDAHACAGVGGRERLFVGALAHRVAIVSPSSCGADATEKERWRSSLAPGKSSGRNRSIDSPGVKVNPSGFSK